MSNLESTKRLSFDRETRIEAQGIPEELIFDPEELDTDWERVYTSVSVRNATLQGTITKIRFGTGDKQKVKWHNEEAAPVVDIVYNTEWEYHARQHNIGVVGVYGVAKSNEIIIVWHGYDKRIRER